MSVGRDATMANASPSRGVTTMTTNRIIALALIVIGIVLIYMGYQSSQGLDDQFSEALTGNFTDETIFYWLGGAIAAVLGVVMLRRRR